MYIVYTYVYGVAEKVYIFCLVYTDIHMYTHFAFLKRYRMFLFLTWVCVCVCVCVCVFVCVCACVQTLFKHPVYKALWMPMIDTADLVAERYLNPKP
jgi:hypothetical protein